MLQVNQEAKWGQAKGDGTVVVTGMVGAPALARASRDCLSFFVNRRWINSKLLAWAVEEARRQCR